MARFLKSREESDGKSPGSLIFIGDQKMDSAKVRLIDYDSVSLTDKELKDIHTAPHLKNTSTVTWINPVKFLNLSGNELKNKHRA